MPGAGPRRHDLILAIVIQGLVIAHTMRLAFTKILTMAGPRALSFAVLHPLSTRPADQLVAAHDPYSVGCEILSGILWDVVGSADDIAAELTVVQVAHRLL